MHGSVSCGTTTTERESDPLAMVPRTNGGRATSPLRPTAASALPRKRCPVAIPRSPLYAHRQEANTAPFAGLSVGAPRSRCTTALIRRYLPPSEVRLLRCRRRLNGGASPILSLAGTDRH